MTSYFQLSTIFTIQTIQISSFTIFQFEWLGLDIESGLHRGWQLAHCQPQFHADSEGVAFGTEFFELPETFSDHFSNESTVFVPTCSATVDSEILALEVWFELSGWPPRHVFGKQPCCFTGGHWSYLVFTLKKRCPIMPGKSLTPYPWTQDMVFWCFFAVFDVDDTEATDRKTRRLWDWLESLLHHEGPWCNRLPQRTLLVRSQCLRCYFSISASLRRWHEPVWTHGH